MMSVPAINSVLPPSGNQPAKINSSPTASSSVSPLGISVPPKISVIPSPQIPTSPSKPPLGVNHSQVPLSLVYENKVVTSQGQSAVAKPTSDKPKDFSPTKPTSNGVETAAVKTPPNTQQHQPTTATPPSSKAEDSSVQNTNLNHSERTPTKNESPPTESEPVPSSSTQQQTTTPEKVVEKSEEVSKNEEKSGEESGKENAETKESGENLKPETKAEKSEEKAPPPPPPPPAQTNKRKREQKVEEKKEDEPEPEKKTRRIRSQVLPYQSPLPELATFINKSLKEKDASQKSNEEKLIVFYKNEFLAVRNAEGGFYLCQTLQNVYRTSHRIRIRWLSQKKEGSGEEGDIYTPDFYDLTDFECILTTVALSKMEKNMYKLRKVELDRIENILKRALDVEKGVTEKPPITEEHPDGIDLSLYKDESQLQKAKKAPKRKASSPTRKSPKQARKSGTSEIETRADAGARTPARKPTKTGKKTPKTASKKNKGKKGKSDSSKSKGLDQLKVSPPNEKARVVAKVLRKVDIVPVKEVSTKKSKSKTAKRLPTVSKSQAKKGQKSVKKTSSGQDGTKEGSSHHEKKPGKNKYSNSNKNKKN